MPVYAGNQGDEKVKKGIFKEVTAPPWQNRLVPPGADYGQPRQAPGVDTSR
jgi:hypothetical protein